MSGKVIGILLLRALAILLISSGTTFLVGGTLLVSHGGSAYYLLTGLPLIASGVLLWLRRQSGVLLQGLVLLATLAWAIWESGTSIWGLLPRIIVPALPNLVLLLPVVRRALIAPCRRFSVPAAAAATAAAVLLGCGLRATAPPMLPPDPIYQVGTTTPPGPLVASRPQTSDGEWRNFGNDLGGTRFSPLTALDPSNVAQLRPAWTVHVGPSKMLESPALSIGRTLYLCTDKSDVIALDAETGQQRWRFRAHLDPRVTFGTCRGVAFYRVPKASGRCAERIITNTQDGRLLALDSATGMPCAGFGQGGQVSLLAGILGRNRLNYRITSAPTVMQGRIVVGGSILDNVNWGTEPSGVVRAYDAVTGRLMWAWDVGRKEGSTAPLPAAGATPSTPNAWAPMSGDEALGLVYVPTGGPSGADYYGALRRPFDERYANSVVALDIRTGEPRWSFQVSHHDLWDYDVASQPTLVNVTRASVTIPALVQTTKRGEIFVLDRRTGAPIFPVVERPVPRTGAVPEERPSPTQPFSVGLPSLRGADLVERTMWGLTPIDQLWCRLLFRRSRYDGPNTLPGITSAIHLPGPFGGSNWSGVAVDTDRGIVIANTTNAASRVTLIRRIGSSSEPSIQGPDGSTAARKKELEPINKGSVFPQWNTPYAGKFEPFLSPLQIPCSEPPFGRLSAIDLATGKLIWTKPFGTSQDGGPFGIPSLLPLPVGTPNIGGAVVTRSGLLFIAATQDRHLRAFDITNGRELWRARLPAGGNASPITYLSPVSGRQFVVILASGHPQAMSGSGDAVTAFAIPSSARPGR